MIWFNGTVESAVDRVKSSNSLLLVLIQGEDELANKYEKFLNEGTALKPENYVAIKILSSSVEFEQFKKIYVTVPVPSVFLIGTNGVPLTIFCSQEPHNLQRILNEAVAKYKKENNNVTENENGQIPVAKAARIQFRLPSNEVRSWEFPNMCTLRDVKLYIMETVNLSPGFKLLRVYPRTAFTPQDEVKTLTDLSLTPNATLIVVPRQEEAIHTRIKNMIFKKNLLLTFVAALFQPVFSIVSYFKRLLLFGPEQRKIEQGRKRRNDSVPKRFCKKNPTSNIHGFAFDDSDTDSDMNTDNGNSTQQK